MHVRVYFSAHYLVMVWKPDHEQKAVWTRGTIIAIHLWGNDCLSKRELKIRNVHFTQKLTQVIGVLIITDMNSTKSLSLFQTLNSNNKICPKRLRAWLESQTHFYLQFLWYWQGAYLSFVRVKEAWQASWWHDLYENEKLERMAASYVYAARLPLTKDVSQVLGFCPSLPSGFLALFKLVSLFCQHSRWSMLGIQSNKFMNHLKKHTRAQVDSMLFRLYLRV